jgi:serine/threonine protein kinase
MDVNYHLSNILNDKTLDQKDIIIILLLAHTCTIHDPTPNTFIYNLCKLHKLGILNISDDIQALTNNFNNTQNTQLLETNEIVESVITCIEKENINNNIFNDLTFSKYIREFIELSKLGDGGFGDVYLSKNILDNTMYAIKKINYRYESHQNINLDLIIQEVQILAKLDHPNINRYYTSWLEPTWLYEYVDTINHTQQITYNDTTYNNRLNEYNITLYIQLAYCDNNTLHKYLIERKEIDIDLNYIIFSQILSGINYIHKKNIIHRDLKPSNIFLNENLQIKIGDFGLSKDISMVLDNTYNHSSGIGTNMYSSPEQLNDNIYTYKTDLYSIGLILLELFINYNTEYEKILVFEKARQNPPVLPTNIKDMYPDIYDIILNLLSHNPEERYNIEYLLSFYKFTNNYLYNRILELKNN